MDVVQLSDSMRIRVRIKMSAELLPSEANGLGIASALDVEDALLDLVGSLGMLQ